MPDKSQSGEIHSGGPAPARGVWSNFVLGLKVLGGELKWLAMRLIRGCESRQVRRRLEAEYATLGRLARRHLENGGKAPMTGDGEAGLSLSQIEFLEQEVAFLEKDLAAAREKDLARRRRDLDPEDDPS